MTRIRKRAGDNEPSESEHQSTSHDSKRMKRWLRNTDQTEEPQKRPIPPPTPPLSTTDTSNEDTSAPILGYKLRITIQELETACRETTAAIPRLYRAARDAFDQEQQGGVLEDFLSDDTKSVVHRLSDRYEGAVKRELKTLAESAWNIDRTQLLESFDEKACRSFRFLGGLRRFSEQTDFDTALRFSRTAREMRMKQDVRKRSTKSWKPGDVATGIKLFEAQQNEADIPTKEKEHFDIDISARQCAKKFAEEEEEEEVQSNVQTPLEQKHQSGESHEEQVDSSDAKTNDKRNQICSSTSLGKHDGRSPADGTSPVLESELEDTSRFTENITMRRHRTKLKNTVKPSEILEGEAKTIPSYRRHQVIDSRLSLIPKDEEYSSENEAERSIELPRGRSSQPVNADDWSSDDGDYFYQHNVEEQSSQRNVNPAGRKPINGPDGSCLHPGKQDATEMEYLSPWMLRSSLNPAESSSSSENVCNSPASTNPNLGALRSTKTKTQSHSPGQRIIGGKAKESLASDEPIFINEHENQPHHDITQDKRIDQLLLDKRLDGQTVDELLRILYYPEVCVESFIVAWKTSDAFHRTVAVRGNKVGKFILPIHHENDHWTVAMIDAGRGIIEYADSLGNRVDDAVTKALSCHFEPLRNSSDEKICWRNTARTSALQPNAVDCGVYTLVNALYLQAGLELPKSISAKLWRMLFVKILEHRYNIDIPIEAMLHYGVPLEEKCFSVSVSSDEAQNDLEIRVRDLHKVFEELSEARNSILVVLELISKVSQKIIDFETSLALPLQEAETEYQIQADMIESLQKSQFSKTSVAGLTVAFIEQVKERIAQIKLWLCQQRKQLIKEQTRRHAVDAGCRFLRLQLDAVSTRRAALEGAKLMILKEIHCAKSRADKGFEAISSKHQCEEQELVEEERVLEERRKQLNAKKEDLQKTIEHEFGRYRELEEKLNGVER